MILVRAMQLTMSLFHCSSGSIVCVEVGALIKGLPQLKKPFKDAGPKRKVAERNRRERRGFPTRDS